MAKTSLARSGTGPESVIAGAFGAGAQPVVGRLVHLDEDGTPYIDFPGNRLGPLPARLVGAVADLPLALAADGAELAICFDNGERSRPLILGLVAARWSAPALAPAAADRARHRAVGDGDSLVLEAGQALSLRCGAASIELRRDGKLVIKGTELVSRASVTNKIKGGLVNIN